jgi:hypothetical protein
MSGESKPRIEVIVVFAAHPGLRDRAGAAALKNAPDQSFHRGMGMTVALSWKRVEYVFRQRPGRPGMDADRSAVAAVVSAEGHEAKSRPGGK